MREEATARMQALEPKIMGLPGMVSFLNIIGEDRRGYIVTVMESRAASDANAAKVAQLWAEFAPYLESMPQPRSFDVVAHWRNDPED